MREDRGSLYLVTGLILGIVLGLAYAWAIRPVEYTDTPPSSLRSDFKDQYRALIASAYVANGGLERAKARLSLLGDVDIYRTLTEQAQRTLAGGGSSDEARALGLLAVALGQPQAGPNQSEPRSETSLPAQPTDAPISDPASASETALPAPGETNLPGDSGTGQLEEPAASPTTGLQPVVATTRPSSPTPMIPSPMPSDTPDSKILLTPTITPRPSPTPLPSPTPSRTPGAPFVLNSQEDLCEIPRPQPLLQVQVLDAAGQPVSGAEIILNWSGGEEHFFTGLKPEYGLGYADFALTPGVSYSLRLMVGGEQVNDLTALTCKAAGQTFWGARLLTFSQP